MEDKKKYNARNPKNKTMAKCGHVSNKGRYFKCEKCLPYLDSVMEDWIYYGEEFENENMEEV